MVEVSQKSGLVVRFAYCSAMHPGLVVRCAYCSAMHPGLVVRCAYCSAMHPGLVVRSMVSFREPEFPTRWPLEDGVDLW